MLVAPPGGEPVLLDFFVEAPGRGADPAARAPLVAVEVVLRRRRRRCSTSAPASCGVYGTPGGDRARRPRASAPCRWPSSPRPPPRSPATGVEVNAQQALRVRDPRADHARHARGARAATARRPACRARATCSRDPELADALERLGAEGAGAVLHRRHRAARSSDWVRRARRHAHARGPRRLRGDRRASRCASRYRGREVLTNPPPSAGGILIAYALALLERDAGAADAARARRGDGGAPRPSARRSSSTGSPSPGFLDAFMASRLGSTTHISVLDADGWACAVTCTNGEGSGIVVPGTGIHVNNMMGEQDLSPLGLLHPPARPAAAVDDGADRGARTTARPSSCSARAGSNRIRSAILQVIVNVDRPRDGRRRPPSRRRALHFEDGIVYAEPGDRRRRARGRRPHGGPVPRAATCSSAAARRSSATRRRGALGGGGDPRRGGAVVAA